MKLYSYLQKRRRSRGQVLILAVVAVVILAVAVVVLFDLQRIIRGKVRVMSGIDAAALTGATWQKHSLNLIGELNMVKACDVLISDAVYGIGRQPGDFMKVNVQKGDDPAVVQAALDQARKELEQLKSAADMLTEMQVRIAFVGPMIGFAAAQQAAMNNGLPVNYNCSQYMLDLYKAVMDDDLYGNPQIAPQVYYGYAWRMPYAGMIRNIIGGIDEQTAGGVAVGTSVEHIGMPRLYTDPPTKPNFVAYLQLKVIFEAIAANDWCLLQALLEADYAGKWWGNIKIDENKKFLGGSEILPIHVEYMTGQEVFDFADNAGYLDDAIRRKENRPEQVFKLNQFYDRSDPVYDSGNINWSDPDMKFNPLPQITWAVFSDRWRSYQNAGISKEEWERYLRSQFRPGADYYSGALSYFSVQVPNYNTLSRKFNISSRFSTSFEKSSGSEAYRSMRKNVRSAKVSQENMGSASIRFNATAKPFGNLVAENGTVHFPFAAQMVLPVFDKVALIPVALERSYGVSMEDRAWIIYLTKFLPALGQVDEIDATEYIMRKDHFTLVKNAGYIDLIKKLTDPRWRQVGIDWLNAEATGYDEFDEAGNFIRHVTTSINRDHCLDWCSGGGGYRTGPGELH
ncbi:MAG: hypothetical protein J6W81_03175 [Lentisphaeria bacterium]|nr:hypothetical protein [Lentisphaeria bacterium]